MRKFLAGLLITLAFIFNSCTAIEGIFKAGVWTGVIGIVVVVIVVIWIIRGATKKQ